MSALTSGLHFTGQRCGGRQPSSPQQPVHNRCPPQIHSSTFEEAVFHKQPRRKRTAIKLIRSTTSKPPPIAPRLSSISILFTSLTSQTPRNFCFQGAFRRIFMSPCFFPWQNVYYFDTLNTTLHHSKAKLCRVINFKFCYQIKCCETVCQKKKV